MFLFLNLVFSSFLVIIPTLIMIAFYTLLERKVMASLQRRYGPNINGFWGLLQPFFDGLKLLLTEIILPTRSNFIIFCLAPMLAMSLSFTMWTILPLSFQTIEFVSEYSLLLIFTLSSLNVYSIFLAGWASNSKYSLLGSLRAISQMISYELILGTNFLVILLITSSLNFFEIVYYQLFITYLWQPLLPVAVITYIVLLAETNRVPFDLPEAEAELVAGYNVEYSAILFAMFFLGEYCSMLVMSTIWVLLFFGGWLGSLFFFPAGIILATKSSLLWLLFIMIRALLPRYRFDQLICLGWNMFLPFSFAVFLLFFGLFRYCSAFLASDSLVFLFKPSLINDLNEYILNGYCFKTDTMQYRWIWIKREYINYAGNSIESFNNTTLEKAHSGKLYSVYINSRPAGSPVTFAVVRTPILPDLPVISENS